MAKQDKEESHEEEELTEEQRIALLEKNVSTNKIVLISVALILIISVSVSITAFLIMSSGADENSAGSAEVAALQQEVVELKKKLESQNQVIAKVRNKLPELRGLLENSSSPVFQNVLINQEKSHQQFLKALQKGMYDLALMVPGSRTWLEVYNDEMSKAISLSKERQKQLIQLKDGKDIPDKNQDNNTIEF